jgi:hypothetical protein
MKPEVFKRMGELCEKIRVETDYDKFTLLIAELNQLLDETNGEKRPPANKTRVSAAV